LKIKGGIEDILITLDDQYHLIRLLKSNTNLFLYLALDKGCTVLKILKNEVSYGNVKS